MGGRFLWSVAASSAAAMLLVAAGPAPTSAQDNLGGGELKGFMMATPQSGGRAIAAEYERIRRAGANTAGITVYWDTAEDHNSVYPQSRTISDTDLRLNVEQAKALGLKTVVHLMLHCPSCDDGWRGYLAPSDVNAFFKSYRAMVNHYAELSQRLGVDLFVIGSEMQSLEYHTDGWRRVAAEARQRFKGDLTYAVNWVSLDRVRFWDAVDIASVSAYFDLSDERTPTVAELKSCWHSSCAKSTKGANWVEQLDQLAARSGRQIVFSEAGYRSMDYAAKAPHDYAAEESYNEAAQVRSYQALLEVFDTKPWWGGVVWWEWLTASNSDTGYSPRGKDAEELLRRWWVEGWRPWQGATASRPVTRPGQAPVANPETAEQAAARAAQQAQARRSAAGAQSAGRAATLQPRTAAAEAQRRRAAARKRSGSAVATTDERGQSVSAPAAGLLFAVVVALIFFGRRRTMVRSAV
jgi:hypothetical protein